MRLSVICRPLSVVIAAFAAIAVCGCRTTLPDGVPIAPLQASSPDEALNELHRRAGAFTGARSLLRMRVTSGGQTRSFRAQLVVHDPQRMELIVYTPVGTTAAKMTAEGDRVTVQNNFDNSTFEGTTTQLLASYGFFTGGLTPAEMGMLILGLPPRRDLTYQMASQGIAQVPAGDVVVSYDPPGFPASRVVIEHGTDRVEIEILDVVAGSQP